MSAPKPAQKDTQPIRQITAQTLHLRRATAADLPALQQLYQQSCAFHQPYTEQPDFQHYLHSERYLLCRHAPDCIIGAFQLSGIIRGKFHSAYLGFEVFVPYQRQGLMRQGLALLVHEAFAVLGLHRLEANIQPANLASIALVRGAGFVQEGYSPAYLYLDGAWRDHQRWALLNANWQAPVA